MSARSVKPFTPNETQRRWMAGLTPASATVKGVSLPIRELHELLDHGYVVLAKNRAGYALASVEQELREAA